jgi:hypothetical protein
MSWREQRWTPGLGTFVVTCVAVAALLLLASPALTRGAGGVQVESTSTDCPPLQVQPFTVKLCGKITIESGGSGHYFFEIGHTANNYESFLPAEPGDPISTTAAEPGALVFQETSGFGPGTTFHARLVAVVDGERVVGDDFAYTFAPGPPEKPITEACSGAAPAGGVWKACGTVNPHHSQSVGYYFLANKGPDCEGGAETDVQQISGQAVPVSTEFSGLAPGTEYTYCLAAVNPEGTTIGDGLTFTTASEPGPDPVVVGSGGGSSSAGTPSPPEGGGVPPAASPPVVPPDQSARASMIQLKLKQALKRCAKHSGSSRASCVHKARHRFQ